MSYREEARERAKRRKSKWNLLLIPAVFIPWICFAGVTGYGLFVLRDLMHGQIEYSSGKNIGEILMAVAALFAWLPIAMLSGNYLIWVIPPARTVLDQEASTVSGADFASANRRLWRMGKISVPICILVGLIGSTLPW